MEKHVNEIKLCGDDTFSQAFNDLSNAYARIWEEGLTDAEKKERQDEYHHRKACLELGIY